MPCVAASRRSRRSSAVTVRMRGAKWVGESRANRVCGDAEGKQQEAASQADVLPEVPEQHPRLAVGVAPKRAWCPELLPQQRRDDAVAGHDEGGGPVGD